jgi:hypothetical protein
MTSQFILFREYAAHVGHWVMLLIRKVLNPFVCGPQGRLSLNSGLVRHHQNQSLTRFRYSAAFVPMELAISSNHYP